MTDALSSPSSPLDVLHGAWRWIVLASAVVCVARSVRGHTEHRPWTAADRRWATIFVGALDVQLTLGILLLIELRAPAPFAAHAVSMIVAVAIAHCGNVAIKRAPPEVAPTWAARYFASASIIIVAAIPWSRPLLRM